MGFVLRDHQEDARRAFWDYLSNLPHPRGAVIQAPTGSGKTVTAAAIVADVVGRGGSVVVLAPQRELLDQFEATLERAGLGEFVGRVDAEHDDRRAPIVLATIDTTYARSRDGSPMRDDAPDLLIIDEAHGVRFGKAGKAATARAAWNARAVLGLTATPYRMDGGSIVGESEAHPFGCWIHRTTAADLVAAGWLAPVVPFMGAVSVDLDGIKKRRGEFEVEKLEARSLEVLEEAVAAFHSATRERVARLSIACSLVHAEALAAELRRHHDDGVVVLRGDMARGDRDAGLEAFRTGEVRDCVGVSLITTGLDVPSIDALGAFRAIGSSVLWTQFAGRGTRTAPSKVDTLLVDFGANWARLGDPLLGHDRKDGRPLAPVVCPSCRRILASVTVASCSSCGHEFERGDLADARERSPWNHSAEPTAVSFDIRTAEIIAGEITPHRSRAGRDCARLTVDCRDRFGGVRRISSYLPTKWKLGLADRQRVEALVGRPITYARELLRAEVREAFAARCRRAARVLIDCTDPQWMRPAGLEFEDDDARRFAVIQGGAQW